MILIEHIWRGRDCTKLFRNLQKTQYSPSPRKPIFFSYSQTWLGLIHGILGFYMYLLYFSDLFWDLVAIPHNRKWNNSQRLNCIEVTTLFGFLFFFFWWYCFCFNLWPMWIPGIQQKLQFSSRSNLGVML